MQAIVLAGGFGTRLKSVTGDVPKPMASVAGRPFLCWLLEYMAGQGVTRAVLSLHHMAGSIYSYFGHSFAGIDLIYSIEPKPLGTGGAIQLALSKLDMAEPVFALNGDSLVQLDYRHMIKLHRQQKRCATLATFTAPDCSRYSQLHARAGHIYQYDTLGKPEEGLISAGFYVLSPDIFTGFRFPEAFSLERDFLNPYTPALLPAYYNAVEYFIDIGVPHDFARAQTEIPRMLAARCAA